MLIVHRLKREMVQEASGIGVVVWGGRQQLAAARAYRRDQLPLSEVKRPLETRGRRGKERKNRIALALRSLILSFNYRLQNGLGDATGSFA